MMRRIKDAILKVVTTVAFIALCVSMCCMDTYNPAVLAVFFVSITWIGLFVIANEERFL